MEPCEFCGSPVDRDGANTWRRVRGWVGGPKRNGFCLQDKPDAFAHDECVQHAKAGHAPDDVPMEF
jgi:hypothetical protein